MATDKKFKICGVSTHEGEAKVRFANDIMRVKVLAKHGHSDINLVELDEPLTKMECAVFLKSLPEFQSPSDQATIDDYIERNTVAPKKERKVKDAVVTAKPKAVKPKATVAADETEDQPF